MEKTNARGKNMKTTLFLSTHNVQNLIVTFLVAILLWRMISLYKKVLCKKRDGIPVIFDSGCTHAVAPEKLDCIGKITPINKLMNGLGNPANMVRV